MRKIFVICCGVICLVASISRLDSLAVEKPMYVTVAAGSFDRKECVVSFTMPKGMNSRSYALRDDAGRLLPLQVESDGAAAFVLSELKAGTTKRFRLEEIKAKTAAAGRGMQLISDHDRLTISASGRKALTFQGGSGELPGADIKPIFRRGGYIHPVFSPSGRTVTDDYPPDHFHHHGIWFAWTKTEFQLFYLFNAVGYVCGGPLPNQVLLSRWFDKARGKAMGFAYLGIGVGGALVPLLSNWLTNQRDNRAACHQNARHHQAAWAEAVDYPAGDSLAGAGH